MQINFYKHVHCGPWFVAAHSKKKPASCAFHVGLHPIAYRNHAWPASHGSSFYNPRISRIQHLAQHSAASLEEPHVWASIQIAFA